MPAICLYFQIHRPYKLRRYTVFDLGQNSMYEDDDRNCDTMLHMARNCYLPMNDLLLRLIQKHGKKFQVAFSISGMALEQFEQYAPEVIDSFKALADTGCVEFLGETYSHSMTFLYAPEEFARQVNLHSQKMKELFGKKPTTYRHTELIYNNNLAKEVENLGFSAMLGEGSDQVLGWRSPNYVYQPAECKKLKLLLRNVSLSSDISLRFSQHDWEEWPLTAEKYAKWCNVLRTEGESINIFMPYETFGIKHTAESGIFDFMENLPTALFELGASFKTPAQVAKPAKPAGTIDVPFFMSWAPSGHDLDTWLGNAMQKDAIHSLYALASLHPELYGDEICRTWQRLQSSDNFSYMSTKWFSNDQYMNPESPYANPYDAYINYMNVLADFELVLGANEPIKMAKPRTRTSTKTTKAQVKTTTTKARTTKISATKASNASASKKTTKKAAPATKQP